MQSDVSADASTLPGAPPFDEHPTVTKARRMAAKLGASPLPILIVGETGTGRQTLARSVVSSLRAEGKAAVSFTGAAGLPGSALRDGAAVLAFHVQLLDARAQGELAVMTAARKINLVAVARFGDEGSLVPDLAALVDATTITLPPLRGREGDALKWAELFMARAAADAGREPLELSGEARAAILAHPWPGNLAELEAAVRRAVVLGEGNVIEPDGLGFSDALVVKPLKEAEAEFRRNYVARVLAACDGNRTQAAKALGVDARTVFRYLEKAKSEPR